MSDGMTTGAKFHLHPGSWATVRAVFHIVIQEQKGKKHVTAITS
ncbi:MAG: hypothetical protein PHT52_07980 [Eubacteriales bacterium]|nr:hypothetical protein [Eubacteriales bacterium]